MNDPLEMRSDPPNPARDTRPEGTGKGEGFDAALLAELDRRIGVVSDYPEETFGALRPIEFLATAIVCLVIPLLAVWWAR